MKIITAAQEKKMIANSKKVKKGSFGGSSFKPVIKLFGGGAFTYLLTEYDPESKTFFGLCDLGQGSPEVGYVSREELEALKFEPFGLGIERDMYFTANKDISEYASEARKAGRIQA
jgi:hypothetical protein